MDQTFSSSTGSKKNWLLTVLAFILGLLLAGILAYLVWGRDGKVDGQNTITVTGIGKVSAAPDKFVFSPSYTAYGADAQAAQTAVDQKANSFTDGLVKLGILKDKIKVNSYVNLNYSKPGCYSGDCTPSADQKYVASSIVQVETATNESAQRVKDLLSTSGAEGSTTSMNTFSEAKEKTLKDEVYQKAADDARHQAELKAATFGKKIGDVVRIDESNDYYYGVAPYATDAKVSAETAVGSSSTQVFTGENDFSKSITVTYKLK